MHIHAFSFDGITEVVCGCGLRLRLATLPEAVHVQDTGEFGIDGPVRIQNNMIAVPFDYDIFEGVL